MKTTLSYAAKAAIAQGVQNYLGFRAIASTVMARYARDMVAGWKPDAEDEKHMSKICRRFRVGDAFSAMYAGYRMDAGKPFDSLEPRLFFQNCS